MIHCDARLVIQSPVSYSLCRETVERVRGLASWKQWRMDAVQAARDANDIAGTHQA